MSLTVGESVHKLPLVYIGSAHGTSVRVFPVSRASIIPHRAGQYHSGTLLRALRSRDTPELAQYGIGW